MFGLAEIIGEAAHRRDDILFEDGHGLAIDGVGGRNGGCGAGRRRRRPGQSRVVGVRPASTAQPASNRSVHHPTQSLQAMPRLWSDIVKKGSP